MFLREAEPIGFTEAKKSHDLLSVLGKLRNAGVIIQSGYEGQGHKGADGINPHLREKRRCCNYRGRQWTEKGQLPSFSAPCSMQDLGGLDDVHPHWGGQFTSQSPLQMLTLLGNTTCTPRNNV